MSLPTPMHQDLEALGQTFHDIRAVRTQRQTAEELAQAQKEAEHAAEARRLEAEKAEALAQASTLALLVEEAADLLALARTSEGVRLDKTKPYGIQDGLLCRTTTRASLAWKMTSVSGEVFVLGLFTYTAAYGTSLFTRSLLPLLVPLATMAAALVMRLAHTLINNLSPPREIMTPMDADDPGLLDAWHLLRSRHQELDEILEREYASRAPVATAATP